MQPENWKIIQAHEGQGVPILNDSERDLLDNVQEQLALTDRDFWRFLIVLGKVHSASVVTSGLLEKLTNKIK